MATACFTGLPAATSALTFFSNAFGLVDFFSGIRCLQFNDEQLISANRRLGLNHKDVCLLQFSLKRSDFRFKRVNRNHLLLRYVNQRK